MAEDKSPDETPTEANTAPEPDTEVAGEQVDFTMAAGTTGEKESSNSGTNSGDFSNDLTTSPLPTETKPDGEDVTEGEDADPLPGSEDSNTTDLMPASSLSASTDAGSDSVSPDATTEETADPLDGPQDGQDADPASGETLGRELAGARKDSDGTAGDITQALIDVAGNHADGDGPTHTGTDTPEKLISRPADPCTNRALDGSMDRKGVIVGGSATTGGSIAHPEADDVAPTSGDDSRETSNGDLLDQAIGILEDVRGSI